jgi:hypothetical protein
MISDVATTCLPAVPACDLRQTIEAGRPADIVPVARLLALETLLPQHEVGAVASKIPMTGEKAARFFKRT